LLPAAEIKVEAFEVLIRIWNFSRIVGSWLEARAGSLARKALLLLLPPSNPSKLLVEHGSAAL
jgi:hypothetical protein